jgi:thiol-disulfide isomerase/thioredoxin
MRAGWIAPGENVLTSDSGLMKFMLTTLSIRLHGIAAFAFVVIPLAALSADEKAAPETESTVSLTIGSKAPAIDVEHWISDGRGKFKPVTKFEPGKVYVVEFWATWCGPCVASMPHLSELQTKWASKGVQIISISNEDLETVEEFLKRPFRGAVSDSQESEPDESKKGEQPEPPASTYATLTSAYCLTTDPDGSVTVDYMEASGQAGIPTSFLVGKDGLIEWIGHPMELDTPLEKVVAGTWNREEFRLMYAIESAMQRQDFETVLKLIAERRVASKGDETVAAELDNLEFVAKANFGLGKIQDGEPKEGLALLDEAAKLATPEQQIQLGAARLQILMSAKLFDEAVADLKKVTADPNADPEMLNQISWQIYEMSREVDDLPKALIAAAIAASEKAMAARPDDGMVIETVAHLYYLSGNLDKAIELQKKAIENPGEATEDILEDMKSYLKKLEAEKKASSDSAGKATKAK